MSQTGLFGDAIGIMAQQFPAAQEQTKAIQHFLPRRAATASTSPPVRVRVAEPPSGRSGLPQRSCSNLKGYVFPVLSSPTVLVVP